MNSMIKVICALTVLAATMLNVAEAAPASESKYTPPSYCNLKGSVAQFHPGQSCRVTYSANCELDPYKVNCYYPYTIFTNKCNKTVDDATNWLNNYSNQSPYAGCVKGKIFQTSYIYSTEVRREMGRKKLKTIYIKQKQKNDNTN